MKKLTAFIAILFSLSSAIIAQDELNKDEFKNPPQSSKIDIWWHWADGNITKEGITADLESMKKQGIVQATILNVGVISQIKDIPSVKFNSPEWTSMYLWALKEAKRCGITIGFHNCDGWSTSGGPWITPEMSMKQFVWSKTTIDGGKLVKIKPEQPGGLENFYRDVALVAYPANVRLNSFHESSPILKTDISDSSEVLLDGNPKTSIRLKKGDVIDISFDSDFTAEKIMLFPYLPFTWDDMSKITSVFTISFSNDGKSYTKLADLEFTGVNKSVSAPFPLTKARFFRVEFVKSNCIYIDYYPVAELEIVRKDESPLYSPDITSILEKTASVFDIHENVFDQNIKSGKKPIDENSIIDLSGKMSADGTLQWKAPAGKWQIIRFGYTTTGIKNGPATPEGTGLEVDKMDTAALNLHFNSFAGKMIDKAGDYRGNTLKFILIDSWECQFQNWSSDFPTEFKNRRGYNILTWIPVLCGEAVGNAQLSEAFLHDFRKTISDLIDQKYYKHFSELCHRNMMEMHAEIIYSNFGGYPPIDALRSNRYADLPMTEFWAEPDSNQIPRYKQNKRPSPGFPVYSALASNKQLIGSEAYTGYAHYSESPADLKPFGDAAYCSGVNKLILHSYVHQPWDKKPGLTLGKFGGHFNRNNPWWEYSQDWLTYQSRIQYILQKGETVADVMFYAGDQLPQNFSRSFLDQVPSGFTANAFNAGMLGEEAKVTDGRLSFGGNQSFPLAMLPNSKKMEFATLKKIAELVQNGAVFYGPKPVEMLSLTEIRHDAAAFNKLVNDLWGSSDENTYGKGKMLSGKPIGEVLEHIGILPDLTADSKNPGELMFIHKKLNDTDIYFVFNQKNESINRQILFRVSGKAPEIWNPENGSVTKPLIYSMDKNQTRVPVSFKPYESMLFVFRNKDTDHYITRVQLEGKEIFPNKMTNDSMIEVPRATFSQSGFRFTAPLSGNYVFLTNDGQSLTKQIEKPEIVQVDNFKGTIEFSPLSEKPIALVEITSLKSLASFADSSIMYFAGKAKYNISFFVPDKFITGYDSVVLNPGMLDAAAEVILNGKLLEYAWKPDMSIDITGLLKYENKLEITVATVCRNRFIGDLIQSGSVKSLFTTSPVTTILKKDMPLKPSGLIGPLTLTGYVNH